MISRHLDVSPPIHVFFPHPIKVWRKRFIEHENCAFGRALDPRRCSKRTDCQVPLYCHRNSEFSVSSFSTSRINLIPICKVWTWETIISFPHEIQLYASRRIALVDIVYIVSRYDTIHVPVHKSCKLTMPII